MIMTNKDQVRFLNKMERNARWVNHARIKANILGDIAVLFVKPIVFTGETLHWIKDGDPVKSRAGKWYLRLAFGLSRRANFARYDYLSMYKAFNFTLKNFNKKVAKQNDELLDENDKDIKKFMNRKENAND